MATYTSHYNLKKPATSDKIRIADFNGNADTIDSTMYDNATLGAQLKADIGIVENTNTATHNISAGQYVIWKGALYTASSAISSGATLSDANLTAVSGGGLNALNGNMFYRKNQSFNAGGGNIMYAGRVGWSGKEIYFTIPLDKPLASDVTTVNIAFSGINAIYACIYNGATNILSSISSATCIISNSRTNIIVKLEFATAPLSITDGAVNIMFPGGTVTMSFS